MWELEFDNEGRLVAYRPWVPDDNVDDKEDEFCENGVFITEGS